jgi:predicted RNA-binding protein with PIN domain
MPRMRDLPLCLGWAIMRSEPSVGVPVVFRILSVDRLGYGCRVALVRILIDGYSLLHQWPELAAGQPRHSVQAREALIQILTHYQDLTGVPVTVFFDARYRRGPAAPPETQSAIEVLYSRPGQTADALIERAAARFAAWGEVLVVTEDRAERETVQALGAWTWSCREFIQQVQSTLREQRSELDRRNRQDHLRFRNRR